MANKRPHDSVGNIACVFLLVCLSNVQSLVKDEYVIGGFVTLPPNQFVQDFSPIFEKYLNEAVGKLNSPSLRFRLVAVDYTENSTSKKMIDAGIVDFLCE
jgi:hypothetical protein